MASIIITEIKALTLRHRFLSRLNNRSDITAPGSISPALEKHLSRFLIAGVDYDAEPGAEGWPVPTGARYAKLCFSPLLAASAPAELSARLYTLPQSIDHFVDYIEKITTIAPAHDAELMQLFRFTPSWLFDATAAMRVQCPEAWRLLLSNEFALALQLWRPLGDIVEGSPFRHPLIHGFMILAEAERGCLLMRHLARVRRIAERPELLEALDSKLPLGTWFKPDELRELYRWLEYASFSSGALGKILFNMTAEGIAALPRGFAPWAIARGDKIDPFALFGDDRSIRNLMADVFKLPPLPPVVTPEGSIENPVERKRIILRDHNPFRWYGMTNKVLPLILLDGIRAAYPPKRVPNLAVQPTSRSNREMLMALASIIRKRVDPDQQAIMEAASRTYTKGSQIFHGALVELHGNRKIGLKLAQLYLPHRGRDGSGARFDPTMWLTPLRDAKFWRMFIDLRRGSAMHRNRHFGFRSKVRAAIGILRRGYGGFFASLTWSEETARITCDLAAAIGPISANPQIAYAIQNLERKPSIRRRMGITVRRLGYGDGKKRSAAASRVKKVK